MARLFCKHSAALSTDLSGGEQDLLSLMAEGHDDNRICGILHLDQNEVEGRSASLYRKLGIDDGTAPERRILAVKAFVDQIHKVPLSMAFDAVS